MMLHRALRALNKVNPTCRGRGRIAELAHRIGAIPADGPYQVAAGVTMELRMDEWFCRSIYFHAFDILSSRTVFKSLRPGSVFVDVGANLGYYSLGAAQRVGEEGQVFAFEPNLTTLARLRRNVDLSQAGMIRVFDCALSDAPGQAVLHAPPEPTMHGHASLVNQDWVDDVQTTVPVRRLDDVLGQTLSRLDTIKIDAEGCELAVLRGAERLVRTFKPSILVELNRDTANSFGYSPLDIPRLLLSFDPNYRFRHVESHRTRDVTMLELESRQIVYGDLFAYQPHNECDGNRG
ncbi:MAG: FkbM family methyltransferase [Pirellulales bacterium]